MGDQVWGWFWKLEQSRQNPTGDVQAFTYSEIAEWARLHRIELASWEIDAFMSMDIARRGALGELREEGGSEAAGVPKAQKTVPFNSEAAERMFDGFGTVIDCEPET